LHYAVYFCYRQHDYENFLCTLLLPSQSRASAVAIRAFNIEIAKVQDHVSDAHLGKMRMKFWEETVEKIYVDNTPNHPVAKELHRVSKKIKLSP
jgi:NADH dehydrogenase [ubiquinone] 1 alpha subcomplex assembly factor 6